MNFIIKESMKTRMKTGDKLYCHNRLKYFTVGKYYQIIDDKSSLICQSIYKSENTIILHNDNNYYHQFTIIPDSNGEYYRIWFYHENDIEIRKYKLENLNKIIK